MESKQEILQKAPFDSSILFCRAKKKKLSFKGVVNSITYKLTSVAEGAFNRIYALPGTRSQNILKIARRFPHSYERYTEWGVQSEEALNILRGCQKKAMKKEYDFFQTVASSGEELPSSLEPPCRLIRLKRYEYDEKAAGYYFVEEVDAILEPRWPADLFDALTGEYIDGKKKKTFGELTHQELLEAMHKIGMGVSYLRRFDYLHRDLKLENILMEYVGGEEGVQVRIIDFGSVISLKECDSRRGSWNIVTPEYGHIEDAKRLYYPQGDLKFLLERVDLFALGIIWHFMVSRGEDPFLYSKEGYVENMLQRPVSEKDSDIPAPPSFLPPPFATQKWSTFFHSLLHLDYRERPSIEKATQELERMVKNHQRQSIPPSDSTFKCGQSRVIVHI